MPPTRLETECWLLGNVSEALKEHWILKLNVEENQDGQSSPPLPFQGRSKLPTKEQTFNPQRAGGGPNGPPGFKSLISREPKVGLTSNQAVNLSLWFVLRPI